MEAVRAAVVRAIEKSCGKKRCTGGIPVCVITKKGENYDGRPSRRDEVITTAITAEIVA